MIRSRLSAADLLFEPFLAGGLAGLGALNHHPTRRAPIRNARPGVGAVNMAVEGDTVTVVCVAPGLDVQKLEAVVHGSRLDITGERVAGEEAATIRTQRVERWSGKFERTVELPFVVDPERVEAVYSRGLLSVKLVRLGDNKRTIEIKREA